MNPPKLLLGALAWLASVMLVALMAAEAHFSGEDFPDDLGYEAAGDRADPLFLEATAEVRLGEVS